MVWLQRHDGADRNTVVGISVQVEEADDGGAGNEPHEQEDVAENGELLAAPPLGVVALGLLLDLLLKSRDLPPHLQPHLLRNLIPEVLHVVLIHVEGSDKDSELDLIKTVGQRSHHYQQLIKIIRYSQHHIQHQ